MPSALDVLSAWGAGSSATGRDLKEEELSEHWRRKKNRFGFSA